MKRILTSLLGLLVASSALAGGYVGDYAPGDTIDCNFGTVRPSTGASYTLAGTPAISVYKDNSTTQSTSGVTLSADFDAVTGLNHVRITTASDGTFYAAGSMFEAVITAGTVDSVSVVGQPVCSFTIGKTQGKLTAGAIGNAAFDTTAGPVSALGIARQGTAQSATGTTLVLDSSASFADDSVIGMTVVACGSTQGYCQARAVTDYTGSTDTATVDTWTVTPSGTITYYLFATAPSSGAGGGLDAAGVRAAVGLASANLDTQLSGIPTAVWSNGSRTLSAGTNIVLAKGTGVTGFNDLDAAGIRSALGMSSANLDTQLSGLSSAVSVIDGIVDQLLVGVNISKINGATITGDGASNPFGVEE